MMMLFLLFLIQMVWTQDSCLLSRDHGNDKCGAGGSSKFFFDSKTKHCQPFYYKGCGGNDNKYDNKDACMSACGKILSRQADEAEQAICESGAFAAGATTGQRVECSNCPNGYVCEQSKCCPTKEYLCNLQYDAGKFGASGKHTPRYFFSRSFNNCMLFTFYGRDGNANNFATYTQCKLFCM